MPARPENWRGTSFAIAVAAVLFNFLPLNSFGEGANQIGDRKMAAGSSFHSNLSEQEDPQHPVFFRHFSPSQRQWMLEQDLFSGRTVSLVLVSIVTMGLIGMILTVLFTMR